MENLKETHTKLKEQLENIEKQQVEERNTYLNKTYKNKCIKDLTDRGYYMIKEVEPSTRNNENEMNILAISVIREKDGFQITERAITELWIPHHTIIDKKDFLDRLRIISKYIALQAENQSH